jgi:hypothetical protein
MGQALDFESTPIVLTFLGFEVRIRILSIFLFCVIPAKAGIQAPQTLKKEKQNILVNNLKLGDL